MRQFLQRQATRLARVLQTPWPHQAVQGAPAEDVLGALLGGRTGEVLTGKPAEQAVMVFGCLTARREAIAGVPLRLSDAAGNLIEHGPVARLLQQPNSEMDWAQYVRVLETHLALYDCCAIAPVGDGPDELVPLHPAGLKPRDGVHSVTGTPVPAGWDYIDPSTGRMRFYAPDEIVVHQGYNPHAPLRSLSPVTVARNTIEADQTARAQNLALLRAGGTPPYYLQTDQPLSKEQADEVLEKWEARETSLFRRRRPRVTWGGLKAQTLGLSPQELEYLEGLKFHRHDYYIIFRVTPAMVMDLAGETGLSQGTSTSEQKVAWWSDVGLPELDLIAGLHERLIAPLARGSAMRARRALSRDERWALSRNLRRAPRGGERALFVWFDDNVIPALVEHRLGKLEQFKGLLAVGYEPDAAAEWLDLGLPPHPRNVATIPIGVQPAVDFAAGERGMGLVREGPNRRQGLPPTPNQVAPLNQAMDRLERALESVTLDVEEPPVPAAPPAKWRGIRRKADALISRAEKAAARKWSRYFIEQRARVLERLHGHLAREADHLERANVDDLVAALFPVGDETEQLLRRMAGMWAEQLESGWHLLGEQAGRTPADHPFAIDDPRIREALERRRIQASRVNDTTEEDLRRILSESIERGDTPTQMGDAVADYYKNAVGDSSARPQTAARTQTAGLVNDGQMAAARDVGGLRKVWLHGGSAEPRPAHLAAQARYANAPIAMDDKFEINGHLADAPGDPDLPIEEVANCSCMVAFEA